MKFSLLLTLLLPLLVSFKVNPNDLDRAWVTLNKQYKININEQSFCYEQDGRVYGQNTNKKMRPASVSKLYTTYWSLYELQEDFRFKTDFYLKGNTLYIKDGSDPFFVTENLMAIIDYLNSVGVYKLEEVIFQNGFSLNWSSSELTVKKSLLTILNTASWTKTIKDTFNEVNAYLIEKNKRPLTKPNLIVNKINFQKEVPSTITFSHQSSKIYHHLKEVNIYSNNFYADKIFHYLGGSHAFQDFINKTLNETKENIYFETGSGLGSNYTTCEVTLKLLANLQDLLYSLNLKREDVISIAGTDGGTLKDRFNKESSKNKVIAKTGTLNDTSALSGFIGEEYLPFVIFNHGYNHLNMKSLQNDLVEKMIDLFNVKNKLNYKKINYNPIDDIIIE